MPTPRLTFDGWLTQQTHKGEPVRQNTFEVFIDAIADICPLCVISCPIPVGTVESVEIPHFNIKWKIASRPSFDDIDLVIRQTIEPDAAKKIYDWRKKVFDPTTGKMGYSDEYKSQGKLYQYSVKGELVHTWVLVGVWPKSISGLEHNYTSDGDPIEITVSLAVDYCYLES